MAYFERHVQKIRKFRPAYLIVPALLIALLSFFMSRGADEKIVLKSPGRSGTKAKTVSLDGKKDIPSEVLPGTKEDEIERLAASDQLRKDVKVEKVWNDGTLSFKVGDDIVTVTSDGAVLYLPQEL